MEGGGEPTSRIPGRASSRSARLSDVQFCRSSGSQTDNAGEEQNIREPDHIEIDNPQGLPIETLDVIDGEKRKKEALSKYLYKTELTPELNCQHMYKQARP